MREPKTSRASGPTLRRAQQVSDEIPTSSMADIAFLLIVFFMVTLTLAATRGLDFAMPKDEPTNVVDPMESVLVEVEVGGSLQVDSQPMAVGDLLAYLEPKLRANPDKPVILRTHMQAAYGDMMRVYDVLRQGKTRLGLEKDIQVALPTEREIARFWH